MWTDAEGSYGLEEDSGDEEQEIEAPEAIAEPNMVADPLPEPASLRPAERLDKRPEKRRRIPRWQENLLAPPINSTKPALLRKLRRTIEASSDKLFFVRHRVDGESTYTWRLAQVIVAESDPLAMKDYGQYYVRWWNLQEADTTTKAVVDCRFCPAVRMQRVDGSLGAWVYEKPEKVGRRLRDTDSLTWTAEHINLGEDRINGPFDFEKRRTVGLGNIKTVSETHFVSLIIWEQLERHATAMRVDVSDIRKTPGAMT